MTARYEDLRVEHAVSAGGVVFRRGEHGAEIILCGRSAERPLGPAEGHTRARVNRLQETATREVGEESGLGVEIVADLGTIEYEFARPAQGVRFEKTVHHYLMRPNGRGSIEEHDHEYDLVEWFPAEEALRVMTYPNEAAVVRRALDAIDALADGAAAGGGR